MSASSEKLIHVATISGAHGIKGEVKIRTFTQNPRAIADYQPLSDAKQSRHFSFTIVGSVKDHLIVRIEGITDRNQAELLRQTELFAPRHRLPTPKDEDEVLLEDLVGLRVLLQDGSTYGTVCGTMNYGAGDILEIRPEAGGKDELYSFTLANFPDIDLDAGTITFSPPEISDATRDRTAPKTSDKVI